MPLDRKVKLVGDRSIRSKLIRLSNELADDAGRVQVDHPERESLVAGLVEISGRLSELARSLDPPEPLEAAFGKCQEAALGVPFYLPCNKIAVAVLRWRGRSDPDIRVCPGCLNHNVKNQIGRASCRERVSSPV